MEPAFTTLATTAGLGSAANLGPYRANPPAVKRGPRGIATDGLERVTGGTCSMYVSDTGYGPCLTASAGCTDAQIDEKAKNPSGVPFLSWQQGKDWVEAH